MKMDYDNFVFRYSNDVARRLVLERREMVCLIAFKGMIREFHDGQPEGPYAMLFRCGVAALLEPRTKQGWLVEIERFFSSVEGGVVGKLRDFYQRWLGEGDEHGIAVRLDSQVDLHGLTQSWGDWLGCDRHQGEIEIS